MLPSGPTLGPASRVRRSDRRERPLRGAVRVQGPYQDPGPRIAAVSRCTAGVDRAVNAERDRTTAAGARDEPQQAAVGAQGVETHPVADVDPAVGPAGHELQRRVVVRLEAPLQATVPLPRRHVQHHRVARAARRDDLHRHVAHRRGLGHVGVDLRLRPRRDDGALPVDEHLAGALVGAEARPEDQQAPAAGQRRVRQGGDLSAVRRWAVIADAITARISAG